MYAEMMEWLWNLVDKLPFGYDFGVGMMAAVNPCGFTMLPIYLTLYLGAGDSSFRGDSFWRRAFRAVWIAAVVTAGFGLLFALVGVVVSAGGSWLMGLVPWAVLLVGGGLFLLGLMLLAGKRLSFGFFQRISEKIGDPREISVRGFFLFGLAFGAASMGCALPLFLIVVGNALAEGDFRGGLWHFISYILGTGSVMLALTFGIAVLREGLVVGTLRRILPWMEKISAVLLLIAGAFMIWYWSKS